jgi:hypothetical protein
MVLFAKEALTMEHGLAGGFYLPETAHSLPKGE